MIELTDLRKIYSDGHETLRGLSLSFGDGMFGLLGPNGAGKTTLLSILVLALEPTSGSLRYGTLNPSDRSDRPAIRKMIGYLPQDFQPIGALTGFEYLVHCGRLRGLLRHEAERRAKRLLDAVDLDAAASRRAGDYSGGMRRRLGIAQAMIHSPKLVIVDEPTAGLDPEERIRFRNLIAEASEQVAVLLSTHICEDIETTCERIGIIYDGKMAYDGSPGALMRDEVSRLPAGAATRAHQITLETAYASRLESWQSRT